MDTILIILNSLLYNRKYQTEKKKMSYSTFIYTLCKITPFSINFSHFTIVVCKRIYCIMIDTFY